MQNTLLKALKYIRVSLSKLDVKVYAICVFIAAFIWLMMSLSDDYTHRIDFPVVYSNYPSKMILVKQPPAYISVDIKSQGFKLASTTLSKQKKVEIDISKIKLRKTKYNRYVASISTKVFRYNIMSELEVKDVGKEFKPDSIYFVFDSLMTKEVPVRLSSNLNFKDGYIQYGKARITPPTVMVTGPALTLNKMEYISTDSLILSDLNSNTENELGIYNTDKLITLSTKMVNVLINTEKYSEFSIWTTVVVKSNIPDINIKTFPSKVKLTFSMALPDYKELHDSSFQVTVKLDSIDLLQQDKLILQLAKKPLSAGNIELSSESVDYVIQH